MSTNPPSSGDGVMVPETHTGPHSPRPVMVGPRGAGCRDFPRRPSSGHGERAREVTSSSAQGQQADGHANPFRCWHHRKNLSATALLTAGNAPECPTTRAVLTIPLPGKHVIATLELISSIQGVDNSVASPLVTEKSLLQRRTSGGLTMNDISTEIRTRYPLAAAELL